MVILQIITLTRVAPPNMVSISILGEQLLDTVVPCNSKALHVQGEALLDARLTPTIFDDVS
eukprot:357322-Chlamydomonas_euryale.AAC.6